MDNNFVKVGKWGECLWGINEAGELFINEGMAESLTGIGSPWAVYASDISGATTLGEVTFPDGASLSGLFKGCRRMYKADLSGFVTDNVADMSSMFEGCAALRELDLSSFNTNSCSNLEGMFAQCANLSEILMGESFSTEGDGSTSCGRLAVKGYGKYRKGKVIATEGFRVIYHSNTEEDASEERKTVPNSVYVIEDPMFAPPAERAAFMMWNTEPDGSGASFAAGRAVEGIDREVDLYAIWGWVPEVKDIRPPEPFTFGETIPFELPEIISVNDPEVSGYLEISETGEEGSWMAIDHNSILPASVSGYLLRLHVSNSVGEAVSNSVPLEIKRANIDTSSVRWTEDANMTYDGTVKHVWLEGLPQGVEPVYSGSEAVEAGRYFASVSFDFDQDNFNEPLIVREYEWNVRKAVYDMSEAHWEYDSAFDYDGMEHGVRLVGLPEGVTAFCENDSAVDAGVYTAKASLEYDSVNYEKPQDIAPCIWEIRKAVLDPSGFRWTDHSDFVYDGTPKSVTVSNLPDDAVYEYEGETETLAGKYLARISMSGNYRLSGPAEHEWEILKASYDMSGAEWSAERNFVYDGETHSVQLEGVPSELTVRYSGNEGRYAGDYLARASFINPDTHNFLTPADMNLPWNISRMDIDMSGVRWNYKGAFTYDGELKRVALEGLPEGVHADYEQASAFDAGVYIAHAILKYDEDNTYAITPADCQWKILKKRIDISDVYWDYSDAFEYDGREHGIYLANVPEGIDVEYSDNVKIESGKYAASAALTPCDANNYEAPEINGCTWAINKAEIRLPEFRWTDFSDFEYDGTEKTVELLNDPGDALDVEYTGNKASAAGRYYAKAIFSPVDQANFRAPKPVGLSWTIDRASVDMSAVRWDYDEAFVYDGSEKKVVLEGVPEGVSVEYLNASATDAGAYTATARFRVKDPANYVDNIPDMMLDWSIARAEFDMSDVSWQSLRVFSYDGDEKSVSLSGLPEGLEAEYIDNTASAAGEYLAKADFIYDEKNYCRPEVEPCPWAINRSLLDTSSVSWDYDEPFVYDGTEKTVAVRGIPEYSTVAYSSASAYQAGTYVAAAEIIPEDTANLLKTRLDNLTWRIDKGDYDMSHVRWDYDRPFTYDGTEHRVVLKGIPEGVLPTYRGNTGVNAGRYKATVTFTVSDGRNYNVPEPEEIEWTIEKADYDMSGVSWDYDGELTYRGRMYELSLRGLPEGVRAVYSGNTAANTGVYEASADLFPYDPENYNKPRVDGCRWQIVKTDYDMSAVRWDYADNRVYNGREQSVMLEQLPNGVTAAYTGNEATEAGSYTAKAVLSVSDPANYNTPSVSECDWQIAKAEYDMSGITWDYDDRGFTYDGSRKTVRIRELPQGVTAEYKENSGLRAGDYTAVAVFDTANDNFRAPEPARLDWCIAKADYDMSGVRWDYKGSFVYDTTPKRVELTGIPDGVSVRYEGNTATDAGSYRACAYFDIDTTDYNVPEAMTCEWSIRKADPDIRRLSWDYSQAFVYDGEEKTVRLTGLPETLSVEYSGDTAGVVGEYVSHAGLIPKDPDNYNTPVIKDCAWKIVKADYDMSNARWEGEMKSVYDGTDKSVYIAGLPEGVTADYHNNRAADAGVYEAAADLIYDEHNYNRPEIGGCSWSISRAVYDMSEAEWQEECDFVYDGSKKSVALTGLPEGVTPVYTGNTATDVGEYDASVEFSYDERNYEKPSFGGCSWRIRKAPVVIDTAAVKWSYGGPFVYDGTPKSVAIAEKVQAQGFFDRLRGVAPEVGLEGIPEGFDVVYEGNTATEAGVYYAAAKLISRDNSNYSELELPKFKWEILKAGIDMSGVRWNYDRAFVFDGEEKSVELTGLPDTVKVSYTDNRALNAGEYEAMATVEAADPVNYEDPAPVSGCWWHIDKASYDMSGVRWDYEGEFTYDGSEKSVMLEGLPDGVRVESYVGNTASEAGSYTAEARLRYRNVENYEEPSVPELRWKIARKKIDLSSVRWNYDDSTLFVYDDKPKEVRLTGVPADVDVVYIDNTKINAGTYTAKARLLFDNRNCEADSIPDLRWRIMKASYDTSGVRWNYEEPFVYDGSEKSVALKGVPGQINVRYRDNKASAAGTYTAKAYLTYDSDNYEAPDIATAIDWSIIEADKEL